MAATAYTFKILGRSRSKVKSDVRVPNRVCCILHQWVRPLKEQRALTGLFAP